MFRQKSVIEVIEKRIGGISDLRSQIAPKRVDRLVEIACHRYHAAMRSKPICDILEGRIKNWYLFSRLNKTKLGKFELHISPDLVLVQRLYAIYSDSLFKESPNQAPTDT